MEIKSTICSVIPSLSTIAAALPVVTLLVLIASNKVKAHIAAIIALIVANVIAIFLFSDSVRHGAARHRFGRGHGFLPIGWIVLMSSFFTGSPSRRAHLRFCKLRSAGSLEDRRLQLLLIAFSFGAFFEGASGFGTPVAVTGAILIGLGFSPLAASGAVADRQHGAGRLWSAWHTDRGVGG